MKNQRSNPNILDTEPDKFQDFRDKRLVSTENKTEELRKEQILANIVNEMVQP